MQKQNLKSRYILNTNDAEITFTFFYFIDSAQHLPKKIDDNKKIGYGYIKRNWTESETASYISQSFLKKIVLTHFHISKNDLQKIKYSVSAEIDNNKYEFRLFAHNEFNDIGPIECTIFKNGYLSLIVRLINGSKIKDSEISHFLRQPDRVNKDTAYQQRLNDKGEIKKEGYDENPGELVIIGTLIAEQIEILLAKILTGLGFKYTEETKSFLENAKKIEITSERLKKQRSRPYVGLTFRLPEEDLTNEESDIDFIRKFVVSVGRTTPIFLNGFKNVKEYLGTEERNMYGPGGNIVYIGKRGWCVYDSKKQNAKTFRRGVIEMTHFVIITTIASSRARRRFAAYVLSKGDEIFPSLMRSLMSITNSNDKASSFCPISWIKNRTERKKAEREYNDLVATATSFLASAMLNSPFEDEHDMLEAYLQTHTARNSVKRCLKLTYTNELDEYCKSRISTYLDLLKLNEAYLKQENKNDNRIRLRIAYIGIGFAVITAANIFAGLLAAELWQ